MSNNEQVVFKCPYPDCGYVAKKEGYLKQHEILKHGGLYAEQNRKKTNEKTSSTGVRACPDCGGQKIKLLSANNPQEKAAKLRGYRYLCQECEEVFK